MVFFSLRGGGGKRMRSVTDELITKWLVRKSLEKDAHATLVDYHV